MTTMSAPVVVVATDRVHEGSDQITDLSVTDSNLSQGVEDGTDDKWNEPKRSATFGEDAPSQVGSTSYVKSNGGSYKMQREVEMGASCRVPQHEADFNEKAGAMSELQTRHNAKDDVQMPATYQVPEQRAHTHGVTLPASSKRFVETMPGDLKYSTLALDHKLEHASTFPGVHTTHIQNLQAPRATSNKNRSSRSRLPPKHSRIATVGMETRAKQLMEMPSLYFEDPHRSRKVITWDQANNARPPLRIDMEGPTPWTYSPRNKPLYETNAPSWTFGSRGSLERDGGSRTAWAKSWFQSSHVWNYKVDFLTDTAWPPPNAYRKCSLIGQRQKIMHTAPAYSVGKRTIVSMARPGAETQPSPADYDLPRADSILYTRTPAYTHQFRRAGTILWASVADTPGPGAYTPITVSTRPHQPAFSIQGIRREKSHMLGPYSSV